MRKLFHRKKQEVLPASSVAEAKLRAIAGVLDDADLWSMAYRDEATPEMRVSHYQGVHSAIRAIVHSK